MSHGHDDGHGAAASGDHGPVEIPPVPAPRMITPARDDYSRPSPGRGVLWPLVWLVVAIGFYAAATRWMGPVIGQEKAEPTAKPEGGGPR